METVVADRLEAFFPFDPFSLPVTKQFMQGIYNEWEGLEEDGASGIIFILIVLVDMGTSLSYDERMSYRDNFSMV